MQRKGNKEPIINARGHTILKDAWELRRTCLKSSVSSPKQRKQSIPRVRTRESSNWSESICRSLSGGFRTINCIGDQYIFVISKKYLFACFIYIFDRFYYLTICLEKNLLFYTLMRSICLWDHHTTWITLWIHSLHVTATSICNICFNSSYIHRLSRHLTWESMALRP